MKEEQLNKLALRKGVAAADLAALKHEARTGVRPVLVTHEGLVGADHKHMLVHGVRSYRGIAKGAAFYDPVTDEVALVEPGSGGVLIRVGTLNVRDVLKGGRWNEVLVSAVDYVSEAPNQGRVFASNWLVRRAVEAAAEALRRSQVSGTQDTLVRPGPDAIWRGLGASWVAQPWGIPLPPRALGGMT
jgi:hypothetical protein